MARRRTKKKSRRQRTAKKRSGWLGGVFSWQTAWIWLSVIALLAVAFFVGKFSSQVADLLRTQAGGTISSGQASEDATFLVRHRFADGSYCYDEDDGYCELLRGRAPSSSTTLGMTVSNPGTVPNPPTAAQGLSMCPANDKTPYLVAPGPTGETSFERCPYTFSDESYDSPATVRPFTDVGSNRHLIGYVAAEPGWGLYRDITSQQQRSWRYIFGHPLYSCLEQAGRLETTLLTAVEADCAGKTDSHLVGYMMTGGGRSRVFGPVTSEGGECSGVTACNANDSFCFCVLSTEQVGPTSTVAPVATGGTSSSSSQRLSRLCQAVQEVCGETNNTRLCSAFDQFCQ